MKQPPASFPRSLLKTTTPTLDEITNLWVLDPQRWNSQGSDYSTAVLKQYEIYVEMADRTSGRRALANTFFLALNTAVFTAIGALFLKAPAVDVWFLVFPLAAILLQCASWFWMLRSYRQLNSAKYTIIGALEEHLPASPYWRAEWKALGEGRDASRYVPMTHLEQWIPILFAVTYTAAFVAALLG